MRHVSRECHLAKSYLFIRALDGEFTIGKLHIRVAGLHQMRGNLLGFGFDFVKRLHDGRAANRHRT